MATLPVRWIEARVYGHATEDEARIAACLDAACSGGPATRDVLEGHYSNPIVRLTRRIEGSEPIRAAWSRWVSAGLTAAIAADIDRRVDEEGVLHLRLDKQAAFAGSLRLATDADAIDVQVRLTAYPAKPETLRAVARALVTGGP